VKEGEIGIGRERRGRREGTGRGRECEEMKKFIEIKKRLMKNIIELLKK